MPKNYHFADQNSSVETFLKDAKEKKNLQYIILEGESPSFVDVRTIALKLHNSEEKLRGLRKPLSRLSGKKDPLHFLMDSGDRIIGIGDGEYYDFIDALEEILNLNPSFLLEPVKVLQKREIFALNPNDKISTARSLFLRNRINLLPVIDDLRIVGEVRTRDFLVTNLFTTDKNRNRGNLYDENYTSPSMNLPVSNIANSKPIVIDKEESIGDAISLMISKALPSIIISEGDNLYSVISYRDVFKMLRLDEENSKFSIEYNSTREVLEEDLDFIMELSERSMKKIIRISNYNNLKISFKTHGNKEDGFGKKFSVNLLLSEGKKIIQVAKEDVEGSSEEFYDDKVKERWNTVALVQSALSVLEKKVMDEKERR